MDTARACRFLDETDSDRWWKRVNRWSGTFDEASLEQVIVPLQEALAILRDWAEGSAQRDQTPRKSWEGSAVDKAWILSEMRLLEDLGVSVELTSQVESIFSDAVRSGDLYVPVQWSVDDLIPQLELDLEEVKSALEDAALRATVTDKRSEREARIQGVAWLTLAGLLVAVNEAIVSGSFPVTGGLSNVGASLSMLLAGPVWRRGQDNFHLRA